MNAPVDVTTIRIETPRMLLRPWRDSDLQDFYEYAKVDGVGQMAGWMPHKNMEESREILQSFIDHKKTFALELKENGKAIGSLGLEEQRNLDDSLESLRGREIGYVLSKDYWGRGLMPEAVQAVIDYCFGTLDFDILTCGHYAWNHQSQRVIEKCGFRFLKKTEHQTRMGNVEACLLYIQYNPNRER